MRVGLKQSKHIYISRESGESSGNYVKPINFVTRSSTSSSSGSDTAGSTSLNNVLIINCWR